MWCILELYLSILGGCITAARPLVRRLHFGRPSDGRLYQQWHQLHLRRELELRLRARELRLKRLSSLRGLSDGSCNSSLKDLEELDQEEELRRRLNEWIGPDGEERELAYELEFGVRGDLSRSRVRERGGVG
jgi:hypothetical protein